MRAISDPIRQGAEVFASAIWCNFQIKYICCCRNIFKLLFET